MKINLSNRPDWFWLLFLFLGVLGTIVDLIIMWGLGLLSPVLGHFSQREGR